MIKFSFFRTRQNKTRVKNIKSIKYIKIYRILLFTLSSLKLYFFNHKILKFCQCYDISRNGEKCRVSIFFSIIFYRYRYKINKRGEFLTLLFIVYYTY